jgi:hypothetical protein
MRKVSLFMFPRFPRPRLHTSVLVNLQRPHKMHFYQLITSRSITFPQMGIFYHILVIKLVYNKVCQFAYRTNWDQHFHHGFYPIRLHVNRHILCFCFLWLCEKFLYLCSSGSRGPVCIGNTLCRIKSRVEDLLMFLWSKQNCNIFAI